MTLSADVDFLGNLIDGLEDLQRGRTDTYDARLLTTYVRNETGVDLRFTAGLEDEDSKESKGVFGAIGAFFKKIFAFFFGKSEEQKRKDDEAKVKEIEAKAKELNDVAIPDNVGDGSNEKMRKMEDMLVKQAEALDALTKGTKDVVAQSERAKKANEEAKKAVQEIRKMLKSKKYENQTISDVLKTFSVNALAAYNEMKTLRDSVDKRLAMSPRELSKDTNGKGWVGNYRDSSAAGKDQLEFDKKKLQILIKEEEIARIAYENLYQLTTAVSKGDSFKGAVGKNGIQDAVNDARNAEGGRRSVHNAHKETEAKYRSGNNEFNSIEDEIAAQRHAKRLGSRWY